MSDESPHKGKGKWRAPFLAGQESSIKKDDVAHNTILSQPQTPSSVLSSNDGSPISVASSSSRGRNPQSPPRLRYPSRLHSRDLTANTFRIYLKHYMDHVPHTSARRRSPSSCRSVSPSPLPRSGQRMHAAAVRDRLAFETPRKLVQTRPTSLASEEQTPRPGRALTGVTDQTPRPSRLSSRISRLSAGTDTEDEDGGGGDEAARICGFTLSHLRRVPELAMLAHRVVDAEGRRRAREERKRANAGPSQSKERGSRKLQETSRESKDTKVKRLFRFAIRQLYEEGSIVIWDGPVRPLPLPSLTQACDTLWRTNASTSTIFSTTSPDTQVEDHEGELSDPPPGEEAYIPLTPAYFAGVVERAILDFMAHAAVSAQNRSRGRPTFDLHACLDGPPAPPPGPTCAEILAWLRRDARWARVGDWAIEETLEWAKTEGRVWCIGNGRWEVCA
ncbi:uncharacterized protein FIBRA_01618 [Fibroporia radiculosa]|uniref:Uncharacterized protein n=1 Tax=Fibroporia radiculosa TaxID=599839 RepID=J4GKT0_9APHY|nr:uncharacterized protein FIBRA_01618 [Fibroporia radiculosa]CCL99600.1 predicted protein [Fibroporia radiculosa]